QYTCIGRGEMTSDGRGNCRGAHLGDAAAVEEGEWVPGLALEEHDRRQMRREPRGSVLRVEAYELRAQALAHHRRHYAQVAVSLLDRDDAADRLRDLTAGKGHECPLHRRNQAFVRQYAGDLRVVERADHAGLAGRGAMSVPVARVAEGVFLAHRAAN